MNLALTKQLSSRVSVQIVGGGGVTALGAVDSRPLEVAEHLPPDSADALVESLTRLAPFVLFSAAIPLQGGWHHINEQWPEYWAEKFLARGFVAVDCFRPRIWTDDRVQRYYRQNLLLLVRKDHISKETMGGVEPAPPLDHVGRASTS